jgi:hypothetical protein
MGLIPDRPRSRIGRSGDGVLPLAAEQGFDEFYS